MSMIVDMWPPQSADEALEYLAELLVEDDADDELMEVSERCKVWAAETRRRFSAMRALESLTPNGSEFVGDVDKCVAYIRERISFLHELNNKLVKRCHTLERDSVLLADVVDWHDDY